MAGLVEQVMSLVADVTMLKAAVGRHTRVPEARWGVVTTYAPGDIRVTLQGATGALIITRSTAVVWLGAVVRVAVQGNDRWIVGVEDGAVPVLGKTLSQLRTTTSYLSTQTVFVMAIPTHALARRVLLSFAGSHGFSAANAITSNLVPSVSAGTLTEEHPANYLATTGTWIGYNWTGYLDLAANTASTLTLTAFVSASNCYYSGTLRADVLYPGEYA